LYIEENKMALVISMSIKDIIWMLNNYEKLDPIGKQWVDDFVGYFDKKLEIEEIKIEDETDKS
jgi:hypothetical protein